MIKESRFLAILLAIVIFGSCSSPEESSDYVSDLTTSNFSNQLFNSLRINSILDFNSN